MYCDWNVQTQIVTVRQKKLESDVLKNQRDAFFTLELRNTHKNLNNSHKFEYKWSNFCLMDVCFKNLKL